MSWQRRSQLSRPRSSKLKVLLAVSIVVKFVLFLLSIESAMSFSIPFSEAWKDYAYAYVPTVQAFRSGFMPYRDFFHAYPPLFLYTLTLFSFLPYSWSIALPLVASDALTVVPVYLIGKHFLGERGAFVASLLFVFAPINLFYADYLWLNPPLTTFFLMLSLYFLLEERLDFAALTLAVSIGFKQTSLLALPIVLVYVAKKHSIVGALRYFLILASVCLAFSVPYILVDPTRYLFSVFRVPIRMWGQLPDNYFQLGFTNPPGSTTVGTTTLDWFQSKWTKYVPLQGGMTLSLPIFIYLLPDMPADAYYQADLMLKILLFAGYGILLYRTCKEEPEDPGLNRYILYGLLVLFVFTPLYKYYVAGVTPFLSLLVHKRRDAVAFVLFNLALLSIPRLLISYLLLLILAWLLRDPVAETFKRRIQTYAEAAAF